MKNTIEQVESQLEEALSKLRSPEYSALEPLLKPLIPKGYRAHVSLVDKDQRKKRKNASADNWSPESGEVRIYFEAFELSEQSSPNESPATLNVQANASSEPVSDLVRALDRTEARPGYEFVALKWFRDVVLPSEFEWARSESVRQTVLHEAIERRLILTSRVPNPKAPQFPVTAIRLNRVLADIRTILGTQEDSDREFNPVPIRGEGLSSTVLRERR